MVLLRCFVFMFILLSNNGWCRKQPQRTEDYLSATWINKSPRPPVPAWPDKFHSDFYVYVEMYGKDFQAIGSIFYDWTIQTFRGDFYNWCLPLFDSGPGEFNNYSCSFLATDGNMYFVNHTADTWNNNDCCLFAANLGAIPPDWMKIGHYNGTDMILGIYVDVWWFPGSNDPDKTCYGYWNAKDNSKRPVQFFGLTSVGNTILNYHSYMPGDVPKDVSLTKPNAKCDEECKQPVVMSQSQHNFADWPKWPSCE